METFAFGCFDFRIALKTGFLGAMKAISLVPSEEIRTAKLSACSSRASKWLTSPSGFPTENALGPEIPGSEFDS
eukprot:1872378-Pyramimonas_sp.AAC.1